MNFSDILWQFVRSHPIVGVNQYDKQCTITGVNKAGQVVQFRGRTLEDACSELEKKHVLVQK
ncbi:MAG: hypothetical protein WC822_01445 [Candidatus Paceibacterota bacterium]|jgi:hypothetical protein